MTARLIVALAAATVLTIVPALIEGHYVNRWGTPPDLKGASERVGKFPRADVTFCLNRRADRPMNTGVVLPGR